MARTKNTTKRTGFSKAKIIKKVEKIEEVNTPSINDEETPVITKKQSKYIIQVNGEVLIDKKYETGEHEVSEKIYE